MLSWAGSWWSPGAVVVALVVVVVVVGCRGRHGVCLRWHNDDPEFRKLSSRPDGSFAASLAQAAEPSRRSYLSFVEFRLGGSSASGFRVYKAVGFGTLSEVRFSE